MDVADCFVSAELAVSRTVLFHSQAVILPSMINRWIHSTTTI
jgi:hypothetical protein